MRLSLGILFVPFCASLVVPDKIQGRSKQEGTSFDCQSVDEVVKELGLEPSAEKGYFVETFRDPDIIPGTNRSFSTAIYYLLEGDAGYSLWHNVDAAEVWHYYAGAPLSLYTSQDDGSCTKQHVMGPDFFDGQEPQVVVKKGEWQRARSHGKWTLVGTTVSPAFEVSGSVLQPEGWEPKSC